MIRPQLLGMLAVILGLMYAFVGQAAVPGEAGPAFAVPPGSITNGLIAYSDNDANNESQIFTVMPDGSDKRQLTQTGGGNFFPAWSYDGTKIAFTSARTGAPELWVMDAIGTNPVQLTAPPASGGFVPSWSPSGTKIVFTAARTGTPQIWVMNTDGSNQMQLTTVNSNNVATWSPDGQKIAFWSGNEQGFGQIWVMDADGGNKTQLTFPRFDSYTPNGSSANAPGWVYNDRISFWSGIEHQYGQIWVMDADGGNQQQLTTELAPISSDNPAWSADGTKILFDTNRTALTGPEIWAMDADGSSQQVVIADVTLVPARASSQPLSLGGDADLDGFLNEAEIACGSNPTVPSSTPERIDGAFAGADEDGSDGNDESLPVGAEVADCDQDGYTGAAEDHVYSYIGQTDGDQKTCQEYDTNFSSVDPNQTAATPSLRWPSDLRTGGVPDSTNRINILDLASIIVPIRYLGTNVGTNPGDVRFDISPGPGPLSTDINILDLTAMTAPASATGSPPMLGGARAFNGPACPLVP